MAFFAPLVQLGSLHLIFKTPMGKCVLKNHAKSKVFQINWRSQAFFIKFWCRGLGCESHRQPQAFLNLRGDLRLVLRVLWLVLHVLWLLFHLLFLVLKLEGTVASLTRTVAAWVPTPPSGVQRKIYTTSASCQIHWAHWFWNVTHNHKII